MVVVVTTRYFKPTHDLFCQNNWGFFVPQPNPTSTTVLGSVIGIWREKVELVQPQFVFLNSYILQRNDMCESVTDLAWSELLIPSRMWLCGDVSVQTDWDLSYDKQKIFEPNRIHIPKKHEVHSQTSSGGICLAKAHCTSIAPCFYERWRNMRSVKPQRNTRPLKRNQVMYK